MGTEATLTEDERVLAAGWVAFADTSPRCGDHYWLLDTQRFRMLAHLDCEGYWRTFNVLGEPFKLTDTYTHWTQCREPAVYG